MREDGAVNDESPRMRCASLLREAMWSMVSEIHSMLDFHYSTYSDENLGRFEGSRVEFQEM
ncbi:MAG: hypothetical protein BMS9Abin10_0099 [Gammaproteobacteria bacterium]|nr:MAG: hypothetical protein BMS9Abin10_0099 [Gammaproteobacteria bacterium]